MATRREFLKGTGAALAAGIAGLGTVAAAQSAPSARRNVILILTDDQRFDALGCMGHPFLETPHLDTLAREGCHFENAFVTTALCSPSRASILTGLYAHSHGVLDNVSPFPSKLTTFPEVLQQNGYETAFIGKWHMGGETDAPRPGFNRWISFRGQGVYYDPVLNFDGDRREVKGYTSDLLTDYAEAFLRQPRDKPFFLYLSHKAVHSEFMPAERHKGCYAAASFPHPASMADTPENYAGKPAWVKAQRESWHGVDGMYNKKVDFDDFARAYAETMRAVDDSVGRVVDTLRDLGLLDSTLVLFMSDNGFQFGEHGLIDKRTMYEPSIRVPLLAYGPGLVAAGTRRREMVLNIDIGPTILEACGCPPLEGIHGRSAFPLLKGESVPWREAFQYEYFWERSFPQTPTVQGIRTDRHKLMRYHGVWDRYELYDLQNDPEEMHNLLAPYLQESESGTLDNFIRAKAPEDLKSLFDDLSRRLDKLLDETGARHEPTWTA